MERMFRNTARKIILVMAAAGLAFVLTGCNPAAPIGSGNATSGNSNDNASGETTDPGTGSSDPAGSTGQVNPGDGGDPTDPAGGDVIDPGNPAEPTDPTNPTDPANPPEPTDPVNPIDPQDPPDPGDVLVDQDADGVPDSDDQCPGTARGVEVDGTGCEIVVDPGGGGGNPGGGGGGGGGGNPGGGGNGDGGGGGGNADLAGDDCNNPLSAADGDVTFTTIGATTDGPDEPNRCNFIGDSNVSNDIWYCYTATCDGLATIGLCGSGYDTKLAVYAGCGCPTGEALLCNDDGCGSTYLPSRMTLAVTSGEQYAIRIGGFGGATGQGFLHIECGQDSGCPADATGDCFDPAGNGSPGCDDALCCVAVCSNDRFCCDVEWDARCASEAEGYCAGGSGFAACGAPNTAGCDTNHGGLGCSDETCCLSICEQDPICCLDGWDDLCADNAANQCQPADVCTTSTEVCDRAHPSPGCSDTTCCRSICDAMPSCCTTEWTAACANLVRTTCRP
ncbi:MAG: hypothetical protein ACE5E5_09975 [Phycisphaerae bacterium]